MKRVKGLLNKLREVLSKLFGTISWSPPAWIASLRNISSSINGIPARTKALAVRFLNTTQSFRRVPIVKRIRDFQLSRLNTRSRRVAAISVVVICTLPLLVWATSRGNIVDVTGQAPGLTRLEETLRPDPLHIHFSGSAAKLDLIGKTITKDIEINPVIEGEWKWVSDSHLVFYPKSDWAVDQKYKVSMEEGLFAEHVKLSSYSYKFKTPAFQAELTNKEFYQDPENPKIKKVLVTVKFTHPVDSADFEKRITLRMKGQSSGFLGFGAESYPFTVSYDNYKGEAYIHSKPMELPEKDTFMTVMIDSGVRSTRGGSGTDKKLEAQVPIPGKFTFLKIGSVELSLVHNEQYESEQVLVVQTTTGVQEKEIMKKLSVYALPKDLPAIQGQEAVKDYQWSDPTRIGPEILKLSKSLVLKPLPRDREYAELHTFKYKAPAKHYLYIKLNKGLEAFGGYLLAKDYETILAVPELPREVGIMSNGSVLSLRGEKKLSVFARDLDAVHFVIGRVLPQDINHLISQTRGDISSPDFTNYNFSEENISERFTEVRQLRRTETAETQYATFDFSRYLKAGGSESRGLFFFKVESWDPATKRATDKSDKRLILITDLGVLVKDNADATHDVFVQSIQTGAPVSNARVDVLGKNGVSVFGTNTDANGHASLPKLSDFQHEKKPTVYLVKKGNDLSFLPYERSERRLNVSRFDVGGEVTEGSGERLSAYLFSDRGIYRPGDEFHIGVIIKSADWKRQLAGIPLEASITDARGLEVKKQKINLSASGFEEVKYKTEETAPTGNYTTSVYIVKDGKRGALLGSVSVRVEEFLPDRLKIATRLSEERLEGWVSPDNLKGFVTLMNLYGTPAINHRIAADVSLAPVFPVFKEYQDYTFFDPIKTDKSFSENLQDTFTNEKGEATFEFNLARFDKATYRLTFTTEGYEREGGRSVSSSSSVLVSPLSYLVGYKPDGDLSYINKGSARSVEFIAINSALKKTASPKLKAQIIEEQYVSVLTKQDSGVYKYQSVKKEVPVSTKELTIAAQGTKFPLPTTKPGDFLLIIRDETNTELNRVNFAVAGKGNLSRSLEKNAELQIRLNKADFTPGEEIELNIRAPYTGAGLITIERDRVYAWHWFKASSTSSVQRIRIPQNFEGNGYVNVSFVRGLDSREIFMSPLSYGVVPFSVSREKRTVKIEIDTPDLARPGEPFKIHYKGNKVGKAVVFAVDEGILQVARYKTPDPLAYFFRKRALEVQTSQILDLILPENSLVRMLSAPGGDEAGRALGKNLNPFKRKRDLPVVYWSGIVDIDSTSRTLTYQVPDYFNGTLRVMAVAVSPDAVGAAQKRSHIRGHFVLSPNVPTFVAPGDEFLISVGVANNIEGSGRDATIQLDLATSAHIEVLDKPGRAIKISQGREESAVFRVRAKQMLGSARFTFTASQGNKKTSYTTEASIRPAIPYMTDVQSGFFKKGKADVEIKRTLHPDYRTLAVSASPLPLGIAHGLKAYLDKFPYLCTEQLVSRTFPAIVLKNRPEFGYTHKNAVEHIDQTISVLRARQNAEGAFGFWAANSHVSDYQTVYALHFLTEAKERGFAVQPEPVKNGLNYLKMLAQRESNSPAKARTRAYAIYVLTRNNVVTTNYLDAMREQLDKTKETKKWKKDITGAYVAASYKLLKLDNRADDLITSVRMGQEIEPDYEHYYDGLAHDSQYLYIVAKHFPERFKKFSQDDILCVACIVNVVSRGSFNTISSAYAILAMDAYAEKVGTTAAADIKVKEFLESGKQDLTMSKGLFPHTNFSHEAKKVRVESKSGYPVFYQVTVAGFDNKLPQKEIKQGIEVQREYRDLKGNVITKTPIGTEIEVHVKMRAIKGDYYGNVAIVDLLPGGFEVVIDKSRSTAGPAKIREQHGEESEGQGETQEGENNQRWESPIGTQQSTWQPEFVDIREDRVVLFGSVESKAQEFVYRIKATNKGKYTIPPAFAESMYDRTVRSWGLPGSMEVEERTAEAKPVEKAK